MEARLIPTKLKVRAIFDHLKRKYNISVGTPGKSEGVQVRDAHHEVNGELEVHTASKSRDALNEHDLTLPIPETMRPQTTLRAPCAHGRRRRNDAALESSLPHPLQ